ncbi:subclass B1 metallo-beta-lactamase [Carboxylicivirga sp. N1Y90]|uniref:subclass B1 metallo-beta-lactamase n=1 Tax=Carboxylicivirga fragile TaxID=3417571 RepID=UPI003D32EF25|nr:subclass B1 metallo-beta-lactamase [Marinilabiliaceae bacterium N1Y90]
MLKLTLILPLLLLALNVIGQSNNKIVIDDDIQLIHLQDSIFVHITWRESDTFGRFPSNGLLVVKDGNALLVDTPMDIDKTERLCKYIRDHFKAEPSHLIIGHYHDDCLGGLPYLEKHGIKSIAHILTKAKCRELNLAEPNTTFSDSLNFDFNGVPIVCRFFGAGHSFDNITVWLPTQQVLFGGCLVKSYHSTNLGNLSDAVTNEWENTIINIIKTYPVIKTVVPGHGNFGGSELLYRTVELVQQYEQQ